MASAELGRRVGKVVAYPPLVDMDERQRREFHEALLDAPAPSPPGRRQADSVAADDPQLRAVLLRLHDRRLPRPTARVEVKGTGRRAVVRLPGVREDTRQAATRETESPPKAPPGSSPPI
jgi:hypothetical protein